ncbi:MAG: NADH-quinone oxidoreductase subunit NuoF [Calditrichaceae bacterium]|nr:NADH-quinone oxidoreductase subunit NuoF [Calditrichaceae bacterium]MBN2708659.1 NADH-quinone oxidoreductase subunit NuoF [Calditrichaceae bacterium]RQV96747.1 MAG: NADH-quinone oxidoreductase subunit NuoF [Calditrichota bacterium]
MTNTISSQDYTKKLIKLLSSQNICNVDEKEIELTRNKIILKDTDKPVFYIGAGTCGLSAGAGEMAAALKKYLLENKIEADIKEVGCIGLCSEEPLLDIKLSGKNRISFKKVTSENVSTITESVLSHNPLKENLLGQHKSDSATSWKGVPFINEHPFFVRQTRRVLKSCGIVDPVSLEEYLKNSGFYAFAKALHTLTPAEICDMVEKSGIRGRGGGGFPTGKKWKLALNQDGDQKYMICNADEGDPGAFMDRAIIEGDPYRVIEGLAIAAYAIGANKAYIYIRAEYPLAIQRLEKAIAEARKQGLIGLNILDSGFNFNIIIKMGAGAFVCGEETALMHSIEGKRGMPRPRPPYPSVKGLFEKPTVINNVETLANIPDIIKNGPEWYNGIGTSGSKGTKVFALSGKVVNTGLVEIEMGMTLREVVFDIGGGIPGNKNFKAVQIGGPSGGCIPEQHLDIQIDYESLKTVGAMMGSGGLVVMDEGTCMVDLAKFFMDFIQRESCGKCIPCREGTRQMLYTLESITRGRKSEKGTDALERFKSIMYLTRLAETIQDTSLCGLGQSAPNPVLSTLRWFKDEYEAHIYERKCPAGVCKELLHYEIDNEKCTGCTVCARRCPVDAIVGEKKMAHYILADKCIGCGTCVDVCKFNAVKVN